MTVRVRWEDDYWRNIRHTNERNEWNEMKMNEHNETTANKNKGVEGRVS